VRLEALRGLQGRPRGLLSIVCAVHQVLEQRHVILPQRVIHTMTLRG
jgi:hypothetical protein